MFRFYNRLVVLALISLNFCCSDRGLISDSFTFLLIDSIKLPAFSYISPKSLCVRYLIKENNEYLFWGNTPQNSIELYDIKAQEHLKSIAIPDEGPGSIKTIKAGFQVINFDTIYVNSLAPGELFLIDSSGRVYDQITFSYDTVRSYANNYLNLNTHIMGNVFMSGSRIILPLREPYFKDKPDKNTIERITKFRIYNLNTDELTSSPIHIDPDIYEIAEMYILSSVVSMNGSYYYQYQNSANLYHTCDLNNYTRHTFKSKYFTKFISENTYSTPYENAKHSFYYYSLQADPFRDLLYRIVKLPASDPQLTDGFDEFYGSWDRGSIMVIDTNLSLLDEILFATHANYSWNECFVGKKGFYLRRSSNHPHYSESKITFDIFEFSELDNNQDI